MARLWGNGINLNKQELQNARIHNLASAPSSPVAGQIYFDTSSSKMFWFDGTGWVEASGASATVTFGAVTSQTSFGASSGNGAASTSARSDHTHGTPAHDAAAHSAIKVSDLATPTADVAFGGRKITGLADGTSTTDAATYGQVINMVNGLDWKPSVRVATTGAGTLASSFANGQTVDGITLATGDRILVKNQSTGAENGIYTVNASGAPTRATDADGSAEVTSGLTVMVNEGTTNADTTWTLTTNDTITLDTTALTFTQTGGPGTVTAGTGLSRSGNQLSVATGYRAQMYSADVGDGSATSITVTHSLGTKDVIVQLWDNTTPFAQVETDVLHTSTSAITLVFAVAPTSAQYRVNVMTVV